MKNYNKNGNVYTPKHTAPVEELEDDKERKPDYDTTSRIFWMAVGMFVMLLVGVCLFVAYNRKFYNENHVIDKDSKTVSEWCVIMGGIKK